MGKNKKMRMSADEVSDMKKGIKEGSKADKDSKKVRAKEYSKKK